jgi:hypothetical protein
MTGSAKINPGTLSEIGRNIEECRSSLQSFACKHQRLFTRIVFEDATRQTLSEIHFRPVSETPIGTLDNFCLRRLVGEIIAGVCTK